MKIAIIYGLCLLFLISLLFTWADKQWPYGMFDELSDNEKMLYRLPLERRFRRNSSGQIIEVKKDKKGRWR